MRLAVIDASPVGGGPVAHALTCAAAGLSRTDVTRVRLYDLFTRTCATCNDCARTGRCTRHHAALDDVVVALAESDTLIVGTSGHIQAHDARGAALLERLVGAFGNLRTARGLDPTPSELSMRKRAVLVCGTPAVLAPLAMLGILPAAATDVWRTLDRTGTNVVGYGSVGTRWSGPASRDRSTACARRLAGLLAPSDRTRRVPAPVPAVAPVRAAVRPMAVRTA
jgi:hypothetical protein